MLGNAKKIIRRLNDAGYAAYMVGGCVRDYYLNMPFSDIDIATSAAPTKILEIFKDCHCCEVGKSFGTIVISFGGYDFEVTTFRAESGYGDGRRPDEVYFTEDLITDLSRRDFTMNAMAMDSSMKIIDSFGGRGDLDKHILATVGEPMVRFSEDYLRMLRAVRFAVKYHLDVPKQIIEAITDNAERLAAISVERIKSELDKLIVLDGADRGILIMIRTGLMSHIIPEILTQIDYNQNTPYHDKDLLMHTLCVLQRVPNDLCLRYAALLHDISKPESAMYDASTGATHYIGHDKLGAKRTKEILVRLKFSRADIERISILVKNHMRFSESMGDKGLRRLRNELGDEVMLELFELVAADCSATHEGRDCSWVFDLKKKYEELISCETESKLVLAVDGNDIMSYGYRGKQVGNIKEMLINYVIDNPQDNNRIKLIELIEKMKYRR